MKCNYGNVLINKLIMFQPRPASENDSSQTSTLLDQRQPRQLVVQVVPGKQIHAPRSSQPTDLTVVAAILDPVAPLQAEPPQTEPLPQSCSVLYVSQVIAHN